MFHIGYIYPLQGESILQGERIHLDIVGRHIAADLCLLEALYVYRQHDFRASILSTLSRPICYTAATFTCKEKNDARFVIN